MMRTTARWLTCVLALLLVGAGDAGASSDERRSADIHVVTPTGSRPTDRDNLQAAISLGGSVLLRALGVDGQPTAFDLGLGHGVLITRSVIVIGERAGDAMATVRGGRSAAFVVLAPGSQVAIRSIRFDRNGFSGIVVVEGEHVEIVGNVITSAGGLRSGGETAGSGIHAEGNLFAPGGVAGRLVIRSNRVAGVEAQHANGIVVIGISGAIDIVENDVSGAQTNAILTAFNRGETTVVRNRLVPGVARHPDPERPGNESGNGILAGGSYGAPHDIVGNTLLLDGPEAGGIFLFAADLFRTGKRVAIEGARVESNEIHMVNSVWEAIGVAGNVDRSLFGRNRITGHADVAVRMVTFDPADEAEGNVLQANNITGFTAVLADVYLDTTLHRTLVNGSVRTVVDLGTENVVTGTTHVRDGAKPGERMSEVMRMTRPRRVPGTAPGASDG